MTEWILAVGAAFWFGLLTAISPCPLATNIAAVGFIGRKVGYPRQVLLAGALYALGRTLAYSVLGFLLVSGLTASPQLSHILSKYLNLLMGPLLILVSMVLLDLLKFPLPSGGGKWMDKLSERTGVWSSFGLGVLFALNFCPASAALFFGSLLPLALKFESRIFLVAVFGFATGIPVLLSAFPLAFAANKLGRMFQCLAKFESVAQRLTGFVFLLSGIYMTITITLGVNIL